MGWLVSHAVYFFLLIFHGFGEGAGDGGVDLIGEFCGFEEFCKGDVGFDPAVEVLDLFGGGKDLQCGDLFGAEGAAVEDAASLRAEVAHGSVGVQRWGVEMGAEIAIIELGGDAEGELSVVPDEALGEVCGALLGCDGGGFVNEIAEREGGLGSGWWDVFGEVHGEGSWGFEGENLDRINWIS